MPTRLAFLALLLTPLAAPASAQPETLSQAIAQVRAITHADATQRARLRAKEAMRIVGERVTVVNDGSSLCAITFGMADDELAMMEEIDVARNEGQNIAEAAWNIGGGLCNEHANLMVHILKAAGERAIALQSTAGHVFPVVNYDTGYDPDNPWTWGRGAFVADTWLENAWGHTGFMDEPEDIWDDNWIFADGRAFVYATAEGNTTRQRLAFFSGKPRSYLETHCDAYRDALAAYDRFPHEVREDMEYDLPRDMCQGHAPSSPSRPEPAPAPAREGFVSCPTPPSGFEVVASSSWGREIPPGQIEDDGDEDIRASCTYGIRGETRPAFNLSVVWNTSPGMAERHMCAKPDGEPLMASTGTWRLSAGASTTDEWRGPYYDTMSLGTSFALVYSSHQRLAWVRMNEYQDDVFSRYAYPEWRRDAATHLLREARSFAWRCP